MHPFFLRHFATYNSAILFLSEAPLNPDCNRWGRPCGEIDYDNRGPLRGDGSNFPCKLYHREPRYPGWHITADYISGEDYSIEFEGTATHLGGSCQLSLSYDEGRTFRVIKSIEGGCPLTKGYNFTIPADAAPSQAVIFSWTWFNHEGNREI